MKTSSIDRVVGNLSEAQRQKLCAAYQEVFNGQNIAVLNRASLSKTRDQLKIIAEANEATNVLRRKYGLADFDVPPENIHIIKKEVWGTERAATFFTPLTQSIFLEDTPRNIRFAEKVCASLIWFKSYGAVQRLSGSDELTDYRMGLWMRPRSPAKAFSGFAYFKELNDAIVATLSVRYIASQADNILFKKEMHETRELQKHAKDLGKREFLDEDIYDIWNVKQNQFDIASFGNKAERAALKTITDDIFWKNCKNDRFPKKENVFDVFARAMFTGHLFELAHLMDETFGKGTLRKIATSD